MKNLLKQLKDWFYPVVPVPVPAIEEQSVSRGRVITHTKRPEYKPGARTHGGRVVKAMPKQLRKIKEAQEKIEDDEISITQLP